MTRLHRIALLMEYIACREKYKLLDVWDSPYHAESIDRIEESINKLVEELKNDEVTKN